MSGTNARATPDGALAHERLASRAACMRRNARPAGASERPRRADGYPRLDAEPEKPRAAGSRPRRAARDGGLHRDLHSGREQLAGSFDQPNAEPRVEHVAYIRRAVPCAVSGGASGDPLRAAACGPLSVPARRGARERWDRDGVPHRTRAGAPAGAVDGAWARAVRGDDPCVAPPRRGRARALPLHDRRGRHWHDGAAAAAGDRRAGQRRVSGHPRRRRLLPARGAREARDRDLSGQLPARQPPAARDRGTARAGLDDPADEAVRPDADRVGAAMGRCCSRASSAPR